MDASAPTLRDVDTYLKIQAKACHPSTPLTEADTFRRQMEDIERQHPGIRETAVRVQGALKPPSNGPWDPFGAPPPSQPNNPFAGSWGAPKPGSPMANFFENMGKQAISELAREAVHGARSFVDTPDPLQGNFRIDALPAPPGEERIEVRWKPSATEAKRRDLLQRLTFRIIGESG